MSVAPVTVCVPCYNPNIRLLYRALESVMRQTVLPLEVILVDDGSSQKVEIPNIAGINNIGIRVIRVTNRGLSSARNVALMNAGGRAILPLDFDDWIEPTYIEKTYPLLKQADVVLTGLKEHGPHRNKTYSPGYDRPWNDVTADLILSQFNRFFYCSLFRASILREIGGYNPKMSRGLEDADLWVDLLRRNARFAAVDEPLFNYSTDNPNSMLSTIQRDGGYQEMVEEMRRHHT